LLLPLRPFCLPRLLLSPHLRSLPAPDVLLPAAGAVLAAVTSSTPDAGRVVSTATTGYCGGGGKTKGDTDTAETTKETETTS
jgi:hypothetical protein